MSRSSYVEPTALGLVLAALQPTNRLVFEVMLTTGLRVGELWSRAKLREACGSGMC